MTPKTSRTLITKSLNIFKKIPAYLVIAVTLIAVVFLFTSGKLQMFNSHSTSNEINTPEEGELNTINSSPIELKNIEIGQTIYKQNCVTCHQADGKGIDGKVAADFTNPDRMRKTNEELLKSIKEGVKGSIGIMPAWEEILTDQQMKDVLYYIRTKFQKVAKFHHIIPHEAYEEFEENKARPFYVKEREHIPIIFEETEEAEEE